MNALDFLNSGEQSSKISAKAFLGGEISPEPSKVERKPFIQTPTENANWTATKDVVRHVPETAFDVTNAALKSTTAGMLDFSPMMNVARMKEGDKKPPETDYLPPNKYAMGAIDFAGAVVPISAASKLVATPIKVAISGIGKSKYIPPLANLIGWGVAGSAYDTTANLIREGELPTAKEVAKSGAMWMGFEAVLGATGWTGKLALGVRRYAKDAGITSKEALNVILGEAKKTDAPIAKFAKDWSKYQSRLKKMEGTQRGEELNLEINKAAEDFVNDVYVKANRVGKQGTYPDLVDHIIQKDKDIIASKKGSPLTMPKDRSGEKTEIPTPLKGVEGGGVTDELIQAPVDQGRVTKRDASGGVLSKVPQEEVIVPERELTPEQVKERNMVRTNTEELAAKEQRTKASAFLNSNKSLDREALREPPSSAPSADVSEIPGQVSKEQVPAITLEVGDKFKKDGEEFKVTKLKDGYFEIEDGVKSRVLPQDDIAMDAGSLKKAPAETSKASPELIDAYKTAAEKEGLVFDGKVLPDGSAQVSDPVKGSSRLVKNPQEVTVKAAELRGEGVGKETSPEAPTRDISEKTGTTKTERTAGDFLKDVNTVLQNKIGMTVRDTALNENQIAALERITQDAAKAGMDISAYMKKAGAAPETIAKILTNKYNYEQMQKLAPEVQVLDSPAEVKKGLTDLFRKTRSVQERLEIKKSVTREFEKRAITSSGKAIARETESGKKMVDLIDSTYMEGERLGGKWVADFKQSTNHLSKQEKLNLYNVLEGKEKAINDKVAQVAVIERNRLNETAKLAGDTGLTVLHPSVRKWKIEGEKGNWNLMDEHSNIVDSFTNKREAERTLNSYLYTPFHARENYLPRLPLRDVIAKKIDSVVEHLIKTGQVEKADKITGNLYSKDVQKELAMRKISIYMRRNAERRYGNLQIARELDLPDWAYEKNIDIVLPYYYEKSGMRVSQAKNWGRKDEVLRDLSEQIKNEGGDFSQVTRVLDRILNKEAYDGSAETIVNAVTGYNVFTKMGLSQVAQVGQRLSALYRTNGIVFAKTIAHVTGSPGEATDFAVRCGGALKGVSMHAKAEMSGGTAKSAEWFLTKTGFTGQDLKSRVYASVAGKFYAEYLTEKLSKNPLSKFAIRRLKQLNLDPDAIIKQRYKLTQEDLIKAGQKTEIDTNFRNRVLDLPEFFSTKWGRVLTQFKSFSYAQTKMLRDNVVKEALHGNVEPLAYLLLAGQVGGEAINDVRSLITGRERPKSMAKRVFENYAASGVMGMFEIMMSTGKYGDPQLGPTIGTTIEVGKSVKSLAQGNIKPAARLSLGQVPVLGQRLKNEFTKATESKTQKATRKREDKYWEKHPWDVRAIISETPPKKKR